jgi:hypothetical protein
MKDFAEETSKEKWTCPDLRRRNWRKPKREERWRLKVLRYSPSTWHTVHSRGTPTESEAKAHWDLFGMWNLEFGASLELFPDQGFP